MNINVQFRYLFIAWISIPSIILLIVMSIHPNTSNDTTNNNLLQSNKWTIVKDYNFRENPSARQNLINDVKFDLTD